MGLVQFIYVYHIKVKKSSEEVYQKDNFEKKKNEIRHTHFGELKN